MASSWLRQEDGSELNCLNGQICTKRQFSATVQPTLIFVYLDTMFQNSKTGAEHAAARKPSITSLFLLFSCLHARPALSSMFCLCPNLGYIHIELQYRSNYKANTVHIRFPIFFLAIVIEHLIFLLTGIILDCNSIL